MLKDRQYELMHHLAQKAFTQIATSFSGYPTDAENLRKQGFFVHAAGKPDTNGCRFYRVTAPYGSKAHEILKSFTSESSIPTSEITSGGGWDQE